MGSISRPKCHRLQEAALSPSDTGSMGDTVQGGSIGPWSWESGETLPGQEDPIHEAQEVWSYHLSPRYAVASLPVAAVTT